MAGETIKRYVGAAGDALAYMWQKVRSPEAEPPVGAQDTYGGRTAPAAVAAGGISTGMLLLIAVLYFAMRGKRGR